MLKRERERANPPTQLLFKSRNTWKVHIQCVSHLSPLVSEWLNPGENTSSALDSHYAGLSVKDTVIWWPRLGDQTEKNPPPPCAI